MEAVGRVGLMLMHMHKLQEQQVEKRVKSSAKYSAQNLKRGIETFSGDEISAWVPSSLLRTCFME